MPKALQIGIIGDFNPQSRYHLATNEAIQHAAAAVTQPAALGRAVEITWLATPTLEGSYANGKLDEFDGLWCSPGSPYESMQGALDAIRWARERGRPLIGT